MHSLFLTLLSASLTSSAVINPLNLIKVPTCTDEMSIGPCSNIDNSCHSPGYMCDTTTSLCCPMVDYTNQDYIIGPALKGLCEDFYTAVAIAGSDSSPECVSLASLPDAVQCPPARKTDKPCSPSNSVCAAGSTCYPVAGVCCTDV